MRAVADLGRPLVIVLLSPRAMGGLQNAEMQSRRSSVGYRWRRLLGLGFVVYDDLNKPRLTLSYINKRDAENGRVHVEAALVNAAVDDA